MSDIKESIGKQKERFWKYCLNVKKLLWPFKWYIGFYFVDIYFWVHELINPPAKGDIIFKAEAFHDSWNYTNQKVYIESMKLGLIISCLIFLLGLSNMKNHPRIAKLIFLSPWLLTLVNVISSMIE